MKIHQAVNFSISLVPIVGTLLLVFWPAATRGQLAGETPSQRTPTPLRDGQNDEEVLRLREGTKIANRSGVFQHDGEGATFITSDGYELSTLPNLNLERIVRTLKGSDEAESIRWSVDGMVTEFNGRNYLLISRAVYKSSAPPPLPEQLANEQSE